MEISQGYFSVRRRLSYYSYYGLAMSRSLGHKFLSQYGIIPDPVVDTVRLDPSLRYLLLTSDGVSDVFDCQELFDFILEQELPLEVLPTAILNETTAAWKTKFPRPRKASEITDNMTIIIVDLKLLASL
jgi:serine/threonine protein phosphatase PrpC